MSADTAAATPKHQHEAWQLQDSANPAGGSSKYCAACGELVADPAVQKAMDEKSSPQPTASCAQCKKIITVLKNGTLCHHTGNTASWPGAPFNDRCPGAGKPPLNQKEKTP